MTPKTDTDVVRHALAENARNLAELLDRTDLALDSVEEEMALVLYKGIVEHQLVEELVRLAQPATWREAVGAVQRPPDGERAEEVIRRMRDGS